MSIKTLEIRSDESYSAMQSVATADVPIHIFVSHNGETGVNRVNLMASLYSATIYMTDDEAMQLSVMLADSVKSAQKEEA
jgi:flavoprotein